MPYDSYTGDIIHRFYQMWQQADCSVANATAANPSGCLNDLFPFVAISFSTSDNGVGSSMALHQRAERRHAVLHHAGQQLHAVSDNMHQSVMGGTGANHSLAGFGDAVAWTDGHGQPGPAARQPDRQPEPARGHQQPLHGRRRTSATARTRRSRAWAPILSYLGSLPQPPEPELRAPTPTTT